MRCSAEIVRGGK